MNADPATPFVAQFVDRNAEVLWTPTLQVTDVRTQVAPYLDGMRNLMLGGAKVRGVGLAAPQVGLSLSFFITTLDGLRVVVNPVITGHSTNKVSKQEGCLSWNGGESRIYVARWAWIRVLFTDHHGTSHATILHDWRARVFQHEADHLEGKNIFSRA